MTREETAKLLKILSSAYPNTMSKITDPESMIIAWEMTLGDFSAEAVYKAARYHMETNKYFPAPSDIRENIVRAQLVYQPTTLNALESGEVPDEEENLDKFCKWVGFGYEPDNTVQLPKGFLPYEM